MNNFPEKQFEFPVIQPESSCGCGSTQKNASNEVSALNQSFVGGSISAAAGSLPQVASALRWTDHWGTIKARLGIGRMNYSIIPGLYALGNPDDNSPVLVTANYKMSFDRLREALPDRNVWILVLDTRGINVWCAAGKGTFGTEELVRQNRSKRFEKYSQPQKINLASIERAGSGSS